jgi:RNA polymerase sigma factor (sigma-70 family)
MEAYRRYAPALMRKCQRMHLSRQDTEDIVQGLFLDMLAAGKTELDLPYLYRAVTNRCINHLKYGENRRRLLQQQDPALRGPVRTPCDEQVIGADLLGRLIERLDEKCAEVLVLRYFDDMTQDEIAALLGTSRKTVGKRLARIQAEVRRLVQRNGAGVGGAT